MDGIAFWARRSPNGQEGIRVAVADKYVDDDMSYLSLKYDPNRPRYCERKVVCGCQNHKPCTPVQVIDNEFDLNGNRLRYAAGSPNTIRGPIAENNGISVINMAGDPAKGPDGKTLTMPNGTVPSLYNGETQTGQSFDSDVYDTRTEYFCFDPAADPIPPPGTPYPQVTDRVYQNPRITAPDPAHYTPCGAGFFCNIAVPPITNIDQQISPPPKSPVQLPVTDMTLNRTSRIQLPTLQSSPLQ